MLAGIAGGAVHEPWKLGLEAPADYPPPLVDHLEAVRRLPGRRQRPPDGRYPSRLSAAKP